MGVSNDGGADRRQCHINLVVETGVRQLRDFQPQGRLGMLDLLIKFPKGQAARGHAASGRHRDQGASATFDLELVPVRGRPGYFAAVLVDGWTLVRASRQPLLDSARALAAEGAAPETAITARHRGSALVAMRSTVGEAAKWRIEESDRGGLKKRRWSPFETARISAHGVPENTGRDDGVDERACGGHSRPRATFRQSSSGSSPGAPGLRQRW